MSTSTDLELRLHVAVLLRRIRRSGWTSRELEDYLGWVRGTLTALARNPQTLRFEDLFEVLAAIRVEPGDFFQEIAAESAKRAAAVEGGSGRRGTARWFQRLVAVLRRWSSDS